MLRQPAPKWGVVIVNVITLNIKIEGDSNKFALVKTDKYTFFCWRVFENQIQCG
jgi:hypothetical protein